LRRTSGPSRILGRFGVTTASVETTAEQEAAAAIVRAIRRVYGSADADISGVDQFRVENVHEFARRLLEQGVSIREPQ
jgi:hypothetical protein